MSEGSTKLAVMGGVGAAAFALGYMAAPREILDENAEQSGLFQVDTSKVLSTTVESLRSENSLVVYSYKGTATVKATRTSWWIFKGEQRLIVPYAVDYRLNLSNLTLNKVEYNEAAKIVTVHLPKLGMSDVAFQPEQATTINGGLLSYSDDTVQELGKLALQDGPDSGDQTGAAKRDGRRRQATGKGKRRNLLRDTVTSRRKT